MGWTRWKAAYHRDRSLRDIYVSGTCQPNWDLFPSLVRSTDHAVVYTRYGDKSVAPSIPRHLLGHKTCAHDLLVDGDGVEFMWHFFLPTEFEFDLDACKVASPRSLAPVLGFIDQLGSHLSKDAIFTEEDSPESIWLKDSCSDGNTQDVSTG